VNRDDAKVATTTPPLRAAAQASVSLWNLALGISAVAALRAAGAFAESAVPHPPTPRAAAPRLTLWNLVFGTSALAAQRRPLRARRCEWPPLHLQRAPAPFTTNKTFGEPIE